MFDTVEDYIIEEMANWNELSFDLVKFTNFDDETVNIFMDEFIKRYGVYANPNEENKKEEASQD